MVVLVKVLALRTFQVVLADEHPTASTRISSLNLAVSLQGPEGQVLNHFGHAIECVVPCQGGTPLTGAWIRSLDWLAPPALRLDSGSDPLNGAASGDGGIEWLRDTIDHFEIRRLPGT